MNERQNKYSVFLICLLLGLSVLTVFWQVRYHDFINFDDNQYIVNNTRIKSGLTRENLVWAFTSIHAHNWHPLTWISHMLDYKLFGLDSGNHHFINVLFHIANAILLFYVLLFMTGRLWPAAFVAAAFALHPLHVESVAWASERKDVLSTFFLLLTIWAYACYVRRPEVKRYLLALFLFALGLLAKQMLITLPVILLLLDYWPLKRFCFREQLSCDSAQKIIPAAIGRCILEKLPFIVLSIAATVTVFFVQQRTVVKTIAEYPLIYRVQNALVAYVIYIGKMFYPARLAIFYPHPLANLPLWKTLTAALLLACITVIAVRKARRYPYFVVGWLWYLIMLIPVIGLVQVGLQAYADRYSYMSLTGPFIIIAWGISDLLPKFRLRKMVLASFSVVLILVLAGMTFYQLRHWRNSITLYTHATKVVPDNWWAYLRLGMAYGQQNNLDEAIKCYTKAIQIKPEFPAPHRNLGYAFARQGKLNKAIEEYNRALRLRPDFEEAHQMLGNAFARQKKFDKAIQHYNKALQLRPNWPEVYNGLAEVFYIQGNIAQAITYWQKTLQLKPDWTQVQDNLNKLIQWKNKSNQRK